MPGPKGCNSKTAALDVAKKFPEWIKDRVFLVTGSNTGIGKETVRALVSQGGRVVMACRTESRMEAAKADILKEFPEGKIDSLLLDLTSIQAVKEAAEKFLAMDMPLHCLINNAGIMATPPGTTKDGIEQQLGTNVLGHYLLIKHLLPKLQECGTEANPSRVVNVSSKIHDNPYPGGIRLKDLTTKNYHDFKAYGQSKLGNILVTRHMAKLATEAGDKRVLHLCLHPGVIKTELMRNNGGAKIFYAVGRLFMKSIPQGAATQTLCATADPSMLKAGGYYAGCELSETTNHGRDMQLAQALCRALDHMADDPTLTSFGPDGAPAAATPSSQQQQQPPQAAPAPAVAGEEAAPSAAADAGAGGAEEGGEAEGAQKGGEEPPAGAGEGEPTAATKGEGAEPKSEEAAADA